MKLKFKRDETTNGIPDFTQVDIGELVMNSVTGKLYTKLTDGSLVEFISQKICYGPIPSISYSAVNDFCCFGDLLTVTIDDLLPEPKVYSFEFTELTNNSSTVTVNSPSYSNYAVSGTQGIPSGQSVLLRQATIPINVSINGANNISIFKLGIVSNNITVTEKTIAISCNTCS
jgi:hypothetical protein